MTDVKIDRESVERLAKALEGRNGFIFIQDNALEAATMLRVLLNAKEAAEAARDRLREALREVDKAAQTTIEAHKLTALESEADRAAFFGALENPPKPNNRLKQAFALRETLIANAD